MRSGDGPINDQLVAFTDGLVHIESQVRQASKKTLHLAAIRGRADSSAGDGGVAERVGVGNHQVNEFHPPLIPDGMVQASEQFFVSLGDGHYAFLPRNPGAPVFH